MRATTKAIIAAACLIAAGSTAQAGSDERTKSWRKHKPVAAYVHGRRKVETHDDVRANYLDPAGDYKAYPSWARAALAPKGPGGIRM